jgi:hypothetical protein
MFYCI